MHEVPRGSGLVEMREDVPDVVGLRANLFIEVRDAVTDELLDTREVHNLVTLSGRNLIRDLISGDTTAYVKNFAVGTSNTAATSADTALNAEVFRDILTSHTAAGGQQTFSYYLASASANGNTLQEAGLFTAASGGTLFAHATYQPIVKTSSVTITFNWLVTIAAS